MLKLNKDFLKDFVSQEEINNYQLEVSGIDSGIRNGDLIGSEFLGWIDLPKNYDKKEFAKIKKVSEKIKKENDVLLVIGIGGSFLGAKAVIDMLNHSFRNEIEGETKIYFVGQNMSTDYIKNVEDMIRGKNFSINIISKSGTTLEPALSFRYFKDILIDKYGEDEANNRIYATTDKERGALKQQADVNNWETFVIPDNIGGRFSVLTAVGLLPISVSGIDIEQLMLGANQARVDYTDENLNKNDAYQYAVIRNILYRKGKSIEMLVGYEPKLSLFNEWWKQLYGESEGKNNQGIFPTSAVFSTDLHSLGQYIQEGRRDLFETVIKIINIENTVNISLDEKNLDELNFLNGKNMQFANDSALIATAQAHVSGGVPNIILELDRLDAFNVGYMIYFFELAVAMSGHLGKVNPFDQPGVEAYKSNMFKLLNDE